jgi:uncharacterized RDD family membrane protein YckC
MLAVARRAVNAAGTTSFATIPMWLGENRPDMNSRSPTAESPRVLDSVVAAETPEGIMLELHPAGLSARFCALWIDHLIKAGIWICASIVASFMGGMGQGLLLIILFLTYWLYPVPFELGPHGATPGKRAMRLKVVMDNGLPITPAASLIRNLLRVVDFMPFGYGFAILSMLLRKDGKRIGDIAAATLVVHERRRAPRAVLDSVTPIPPARALPARDQTALIALAARAPTLTIERLDELAALAAAVQGSEPRTATEVTRRVLGVSQWLLGRRP